MDEISDIQRRAGIVKSETRSYEVHVYHTGNSRPFVSTFNTSGRVIQELDDIFHSGSSFDRIVIVPRD